MPPRLSTSSALRGQNLLARCFSSTAPASKPPYPSPAHNSPRHAAPTASHHHFPSHPKPHHRAAGGGPRSSSTGDLSDMFSRASSRPQGPRAFTPTDAAGRVMANMKARAASVAEKSMADLELQRDQQLSKDYLKQMPRSWAAGDVYSPRDLSPYQMGKFRTRARRTGDVIDALGINPVDHYTNFSIISDFTTASAMIKHSAETNLRPANQRKIAKMIRRAQGLGLYPTIHKHPEMLREDFFPTDK